MHVYDKKISHFACFVIQNCPTIIEKLCIYSDLVNALHLKKNSDVWFYWWQINIINKSKGINVSRTWFGEDIKFYQSCAFYYKCTEALTLNETSDYLHPQPVMVHTFYH